MKLYSMVFTVALSVVVVTGCSSSNDDDSLLQGSTDPALIQDRIWALFAAQDDSGNLIPVNQDTSFDNPFEFRILFRSNLIMLSGQEVNSVIGINVCNGFSGGYTLTDGLLTFTTLAQNDESCDRGSELASIIFENVIFTFNATSMLSINTETNVLTIASGTNEALFFEVSDEPIIPQ